MIAGRTSRVFIADTPAEAWHIRNVLAQHGIEAQLKNETLFGATGEIPVLESLPEVWVGQGDAAVAQALIKEIRSVPDTSASWTCRHCRERVEGVFAVCWNCGTAAAEGPTT